MAAKRAPMPPAPLPLPPVPVPHRCEAPACTAWGCFGFAAAGHTHWFCPAHRTLGQVAEGGR